MRRNTLLIIVTVVGALALVSLNANAAPDGPWQAWDQTVTGKVERSESQYTLTSGKRRYVIFGQDFSAYVGKKVKATGQLTKGDTKTMLQVKKISEVPAKTAPAAKKDK